MDKATPFKLKQQGGSLDVRLTAAFVRANKLKAGDYVIIDMTKVRVVRAEDFELLGRELEAEPEAV